MESLSASDAMPLRSSEVAKDGDIGAGNIRPDPPVPLCGKALRRGREGLPDQHSRYWPALGGQRE
jgi:hypothetical protein